MRPGAEGPGVIQDLSQLVDRTRDMVSGRGRTLIGLTGAPGSGKSTLAAQLAEGIGSVAVVVPMDGFHLTNEELVRLHSRDRKGAPDTFDSAGYLSMLGRLRTEAQHTVYVPEFDRDREMSIAGAIAVRPEHVVVITEGNYLLLDTPEWRGIRASLDEVWFVETGEALRLDRLIRRHATHGKSPDAAARWATTSDQANAELVRASREHADVVVRTPG